MKRIFLVVVAVILSGLFSAPASSSPSILSPFMLHGGIGYGKLAEDGAPDGSLGFAGGIVYRPAHQPIGIGGELSYVMLGKEADYAYSAYYDVNVSAEAKVSAIPMTGQLYFFLPSSGPVGGFFDAGAGLYNVRWQVQAAVNSPYGSASVSESDSQTKPGINFGGGLSFGGPRARVSFAADLRYHIIMTDDTDTKMVTAFGRLVYR